MSAIIFYLDISLQCYNVGNSVLKYPCSLFVLERTGPLISATVSRNKLNIDSTPRVYALVRHEYVACAAERADQD